MTKDKMSREQILEKEIASLTAKLATQEVKGISSHISLAKEVDKLRAKGGSTAGQILVHPIHDHKNISLWTREGDRLGPMHPDNAIAMLNEYASKGVILLVERPTQTEIDAYKETDEYKTYAKNEAKRRAGKNKSRRSGQMERLTEAISKMAGVKVESHVLQQHEVK